MADLDRGERTSGVYISNFEETAQAKIDESGLLQVSAPPPVTPPGKTSVIKSGYGDVSGRSFEDETFVIPNGETLILSYFAGGGHPGTSDYSVIELWDCPNGSVDGSSIIIEAAFTPGNVRAQLNEEFFGDGTRAIVLRRKRLNAGTHLLYGKFTGYY